ncbi:MAG: Mrp/NBP35 family ATP-binding protein [Bacteroidales bacterium]|nr:Mrp/NBP35 family ATP-binding protein [Bacteroidales bacterium]
MKYTKEQVVKALSKVLYFPKGENIIALKMLDDIKIEGKKISFSIIFPKMDDKTIPLVIKASEEAIISSFGNDVKIKGNIQAKAKNTNSSLSDVKNIIAIASGKGGVGKSTVAANLAIALSKKGLKVGLIDADIYGPSIPIMFGLENERPQVKEINGKHHVIPIEKYGIKLLSIGFFVDSHQALIWRGPMASNALNQLFNDADWGELDFLIVDLPPGTGDIHLTLAQTYPVSGAIIVSTPQQVAISDVRKATSMFQQDKIMIPIIGLIENMAYFTPAELPNNKYYIFGENGCTKFADELKIPFLGQIPLVQGISESGDKGKPIALDENNPSSKAFNEIAEIIIK